MPPPSSHPSADTEKADAFVPSYLQETPLCFLVFSHMSKPPESRWPKLQEKLKMHDVGLEEHCVFHTPTNVHLIAEVSRRES